MQGEVHSEPDFDGIIAQSPALKAVLALAREMAVSDAPVLMPGEAGSGEESIARAIHRIRGRRNHSFVSKCSLLWQSNGVLDWMWNPNK